MHIEIQNSCWTFICIRLSY